MRRREESLQCSMRHLDTLAMNGVKRKGVEWLENVQGVKSGVSERTRVKEGMRLLKSKLWDYVKEWKELGLRCLWVRMKEDCCMRSGLLQVLMYLIVKGVRKMRVHFGRCWKSVLAVFMQGIRSWSKVIDRQGWVLWQLSVKLWGMDMLM